MSGIGPSPSIAETVAWLEEHAQNCLRIAKTKTGHDRGGWIEDFLYFRTASALLESAYNVKPPIITEEAKW